MKKLYLFLGVLLCFSIAGAQDTGRRHHVESYAQLRLSSNLSGQNVFQIRRLKLKLTSTPSFSQHWSYYVKFEVSSKHLAEPHLLDMRVGYKVNNFKFYFGQFLPDFSLERFQPDTWVPDVERAQIIDDFIPAGGIGKRDLGMQMCYVPESGKFYTSVGVFNGRGVKWWQVDNSTYLVVNKSYLKLGNDSLFGFELGYSAMYRYAHELPLPSILGDGMIFTGQDIRLNAFARFYYSGLSLQGEYIVLWLNAQRAYGYYLMADYTCGKNQFVFSAEKEQDLNPLSSDTPLFYLGYNYLIKGHDLKLSFAYAWHIYHGQWQDPLLMAQLQIFFIK